MSDEKVLTKEIAEQFLADEDSVDLDEFTAIEDEAAEILSKHEGVLDLCGLTTIPDEIMNRLSRAVGDLQLPPTEDLLLFKTEGNDISEQAINHARKQIVIGDFISDVDTVGDMLCSNHNDEYGHFLYGSISRFRIRMTIARNCGRVTATVAEKLLELEESYEDGSEEFPARPLSDPNVSVMRDCITIDDDAAEVLLRHKGNLYLDNLVILSDGAAEILSKHEGELSIELDNLPDSAAAILRKHPSFADED